MHAIAMVHKMQRLALSSSSMIPVAIHEEEKEEGPGVESTVNHRDELDAIDIDPSSSTAASSAAAPAAFPARGSSIAGGSTADPMDL